MKNINIKIRFTESLLGTAPKNKTIYEDFVGSKAPDATTIEDEIEALGVEAVAEKGMTGFPKTEDGKPFLYDYQIKGFFKGTCGFLRNVKGTKSAGLTTYKKKIDGLVFVSPRIVPIEFDGEMGVCQRPLRAQTMQGERVSLASSEEIPAGATITFTVNLLRDEDEDLLREWLDYGAFSGMGQWRNSGHGRFEWQEV